MTYRIMVIGSGFASYECLYWRVKDYSIEYEEGFVVLKTTDMKGLQKMRMFNKNDLSRILVKELDRTVTIDHTVMERDN